VESERLQHGTGEAYHPPLPPDAVIYPENTEEVAEAMSVCADGSTPVVAYGAGTSLEGHVTALHGGVCIDMSRMNRIIAIRPDDLDATVEAGVTRMQLNDALQPQGLFFPVDPGADATLGGMAATRAAGTTTMRYGAMRENVITMRVVLADGTVISTGGRVRKSSSGYDLARLFIGSEGTLGIITELTLRVQGTPEAMSAAVCAFPTVEAAVTCVIRTVQLGIAVARAEFLDELYVDAVNRRSGLDNAVAPTVFFEFHGSAAGVAEQAEEVTRLARDLGALDPKWATSQEERSRLWRARHEAHYAALALRPGSRALITDVCVPISRLAQCILQTKADIDASPALGLMLGHVADGNFHVSFVLDPDRPDELAEAQRLNQRMIERALAMEGTCTGEHGIGYGKGRFLRLEHGPALDVMRTLKLALDPKGILNPGKLTEAAD
jgi:D-lactate dehydrogenase (cytochrome)